VELIDWRWGRDASPFSSRAHFLFFLRARNMVLISTVFTPWLLWLSKTDLGFMDGLHWRPCIFICSLPCETSESNAWAHSQVGQKVEQDDEASQNSEHTRRRVKKLSTLRASQKPERGRSGSKRWVEKESGQKSELTRSESNIWAGWGRVETCPSLIRSLTTATWWHLI